jgi:inner membrane protein involved in colicin E2 resistance
MDSLLALLVIFLLLVFIATLGCVAWFIIIKIRGYRRPKDMGESAELKTEDPESDKLPQENLANPAPRKGNPSRSEPLVKSASGSFLLRLGLSGAISLLMLIPLNFIMNLTRERSFNYASVIAGIGSEWGKEKTLSGPVLVIPYVIGYEVEERIPLSIPLPAPGAAPEQGAYSSSSAAPSSSYSSSYPSSSPSSPSSQDFGTLRESPEASASGLSLATSYYGTVKKRVRERRLAYLTPETLKVAGDIRTETRWRGIYKALVYTADVSYEGKFVKPDFDILDKRTEKVLWEESYLVSGLNEPVSLKGVSKLKLGDREIAFRPGTNNLKIIPGGFSAPTDISGPEELSFSYNFSVSGSGLFKIAPTAQNSEIILSSDWPHPSFIGSGLPLSRAISADGFSANWVVPNLVRNYPDFAEVDKLETNRTGVDFKSPLEEYVVGVGFIDVLDHYSLVTRAVKYAILFIVLTFLSYLLFEKGPNEGKLSYVHLALIALSLGLFYLALLALSEHMTFSRSFLLSALLIILMNGSYVLISVKKIKNALVMALNLAILYLVLYLILGQEDYALLSGTALLTYALCALMYGTRNIGRDANGS